MSVTRLSSVIATTSFY